MLGSLETLHPVFKAAVDAILQDMKGLGWDPIIGSGMRSPSEQEALYAQGRDTLQDVNALRLRAGLTPLSKKENKIVTYAKGGKSYHNMPEAIMAEGRQQIVRGYGYAVDIIDRKKGWDIADPQFWVDLGTSAKAHGCEWGGDWKKPDPAHVQMLLIDMAPEQSAWA